MTALLLVLLAATSAACPVGATALASGLDRAELRFTSLDPAGFVDALRAASLDLPCLDEPVSPDLAIRYHTLVGLERYAAGRLDEAQASFSAARRAAPHQGLPLSLVPAGHELHAQFADAPIDGPRRPVPRPAVGDLLLDGKTDASRPEDRPVIFQRIGEGGAVTDTRYLLPSDPLPPYEVASPVVTGTPAPPARRRPPWGWLGASAAAGVASVTLFALGNHWSGQFHDATPQVDREGLVTLQRRTNLSYTGAGIAGVAAGGGAAVFVIGWAAGAGR